MRKKLNFKTHIYTVYIYENCLYKMKVHSLKRHFNNYKVDLMVNLLTFNVVDLNHYRLIHVKKAIVDSIKKIKVIKHVRSKKSIF